MKILDRQDAIRDFQIKKYPYFLEVPKSSQRRRFIASIGVNLTLNPCQDVILSSLTDHHNPCYPTLTLPL
jgi:hypothetical protein